MRESAYRRYQALQVFPGLDLVRAASVAWVVWHHSDGSSVSVEFLRRGFLGVDMFFVLSGFLIVSLLLRERDKYGEISLSQFYMRRTLRIFPLYYGLILGLTAIGLVAGAPQLVPADQLPWLLTYTSNWVEIAGIMAVAWSLAAEEQFYLVWPSIERFCRQHWLWIWCVAFALNQGFNFAIFDAYLPTSLQHDQLPILQATFTPILLGVVLAHALHDQAVFARLWTVFGRAQSSWGFALLLVLLVIAIPGDVSGWPRLLIHFAMTGLLGSLVLHPGKERSSGFIERAFSHLGRVSYGVYLLHMFCVQVAHVLLRKMGWEIPGALFLVTLVMSWGVATASFEWFEKRFLALKGRFAPGSKKRSRAHLPTKARSVPSPKVT